MKNIHVLPTDKPSRLYTVNSIGKLDWSKDYLHQIDGGRNQNIYITSDEVIKEGDYSFYPPFGVGKNIVIDGELCFHIEAKNGKGSFTQRTYQTLDLNKKIILTTDQELFKDGVQAIDDEFLEWFVKNPICESVEVENQWEGNGTMFGFKMGNASSDGEFVYKIIIPKEEPNQEFLKQKRMSGAKTISKILEESKQETLEEAALKHCDMLDKFPALVNPLFSFKQGAKWQQERMYSEEDIKQFGLYLGDNLKKLKGKTIDEIFEQFKNK